MMKRLAFLVALLVGVAACQDQPPTMPNAQLDEPLFSGGDCTGDFHFGDNCHGVDGSEGSHYRMAHINWRQTGTRTAEFTYILAFRSSFYGITSIGQTLFPANVNFGDATSTTPQFTVTFVDAANDWFEARATFSKTYTGDGPFTVSSQDCCRIGVTSPWAHMNNPDDAVRIETIVNFAATGSPVSGLPPIVTCPRDATCTFAVPAAAPGGQTIRYRLATPAEMGSGTVQPPGASVNSNTGIYTWNTTGAAVHPTFRSVYSTQVVMETLSGGNVVTKSAIDFLIELANVPANAPPVFNSPTPGDGTVLTVAPGSTLTFTVNASDPNPGDVVTLGALGLPPGATFPIPTAANPVITTFSFTPTAGQLGNDYIVNLLATDQRGASASRSITIQVRSMTPPPPQQCTAAVATVVPLNRVYDSSGSPAGTINLGSNRVFVDILDIESFIPRPAARAEDVRLGGTWTTGTPAASFTVADLNGDGNRDVMVAFGTQRLVTEGNLAAATSEITVWGRDRNTGALFCGTSSVTVVP